MNYIISGGSGFIGTHLIHLLSGACLKSGDHIYDLDIVIPDATEQNRKVDYIRLDVRHPFDFAFTPTEDDVIFNLAAVHRSFGHADIEYFETNIRGAENVTAFAEKYNIHKLLFTSSVAVYGPGEDLKEETTLPMPDTPYGISKLIAEKIHETWAAKNPARELTIVRPGLVYGKGGCGDMTRLYNEMRDHHFAWSVRKDALIAAFYVKELVLFFKYRMIDNSFPGVELYNCTSEPAYTLQRICETMRKETDMYRHIPLIPGRPYPERLMTSQNISGKKLAASDYEFRYTLERSFRDWFNDCGWKGLR